MGGYVDVAGPALDAVCRYCYVLRCVSLAEIARGQPGELLFCIVAERRRILGDKRGEHETAAGPEVGCRGRAGRQERQDNSCPDGGPITSGDVVWFQMAGREMSGQRLCYFAEPPAR